MNARSSACMAIGGGCDGRFRSRQPADKSVTETTKTCANSRKPQCAAELLDERSAGASHAIAEALEPLGYEFHMLATRLHETLPHLIALPYNPHDSANHMLALTQDIIERVGRSNKARQEVAAVAGGGDDKGTSRLSSEFKPVGKLGSEIGKVRV